MSRFRRLSALSFALLFTASLASAAPRQEKRSSWPRAVASVPTLNFAGLWEWLSSAWTKAGCIADPGGQCKVPTVAPPAVQVDEGCGADPGGQCKDTAVAPPAVQVDAGCGADPGGTPGCAGNR